MPLASFRLRVLARGLDVGVIAAVNVGLAQVMGYGFDWLVLGAILVLFYFVAFDVLAGTTPGKAALGLRVLGPGGGRPSVAQALRREAFTVLGALPFVGPPLALGAWIWIARSVRADPQGQGKHDTFAGGTLVVSRTVAPGPGVST